MKQREDEITAELQRQELDTLRLAVAEARKAAVWDPLDYFLDLIGFDSFSLRQRLNGLKDNNEIDQVDWRLNSKVTTLPKTLI